MSISGIRSLAASLNRYQGRFASLRDGLRQPSTPLRTDILLASDFNPKPVVASAKPETAVAALTTVQDNTAGHPHLAPVGHAPGPADQFGADNLDRSLIVVAPGVALPRDPRSAASIPGEP
ncbi:hypothetical protein [Micromonospora sp. NPDC002717]|uniref:hypothetical protein n=1 Tax=Micromonospora sp. NPDC002717 TaxID=3154424 RepID=UPI00332244E2